MKLRSDTDTTVQFCCEALKRDTVYKLCDKYNIRVGEDKHEAVRNLLNANIIKVTATVVGPHNTVLAD